jgi:DNA-binding CsgD family transcriptional regulator
MNVLDPGMTKTDLALALRIVAAWTAALQGAGDLGRAADLMQVMMQGRYVCVARRSGTTDVKRIYASHTAPRADTPPPADVRAGCVVADTYKAVIVLDRHADQCDTFEIGLNRPLTAMQHSLLDLLAAELADSWARRQPGIVSARIVEQARRNTARKTRVLSAPILDYSNPYALSRSEFRVCAMIGQGLTAKHIAQVLHLSEATVRSHQRAIYAKTALSGQIEVMFHLQTYPTAKSLLGDVSMIATC